MENFIFLLKFFIYIRFLLPRDLKRQKIFLSLNISRYYHQHCFSNSNLNQYVTKLKKWNHKALRWKTISWKQLICKTFTVNWCVLKNNWVRWNLQLGKSFEISPEKVKLNGKNVLQLMIKKQLYKEIILCCISQRGWDLGLLRISAWQ